MKIYGVPIPNDDILTNKTPVTGIAIIFTDLLDNINERILVVKGLLTPAIVVRFPNAIAIISETGSWNSHGVSLANAHNIPCIVGIGHEIENIQNGMVLSINFEEGFITY